MYMRDDWQQALSFLIAQSTIIEAQVLRMKYPALNYAELCPIDGTGPEWAKSVTFFSLDQFGHAEWFHHMANDVPVADIMRRKHESGIEMAAVGYRYTTEELQQTMQIPGTNLTTERAAAARRSYEEFCHAVTLIGSTSKGWLGMLNHTSIPVVNCGTTWATSLALGTQAGVDAVLQSVNGLLTNIWVESNTVEMADTLLLPLSSMGQLATFQLPNTTMNLLSWIRENNIYTQTTGQQLMIRQVRGLDTAGASGGPRAIAYTKDPQNLKLHRPMPHRFLDVMRTGPLVYVVPGIFRLAGFEVRYPMALRYLDGI